jgi:transcriptional regulator with XRE-family HTH domain
VSGKATPAAPAAEVEVRQLRAARALLGWSEAKLAQMSKISVDAVKQLERGHSVHAHLAARRAFEVAGIVFLASGEAAGGGVGLRLTAHVPLKK